MRYIVIGDIHGCLEELMELLDGLRLQDDDILVPVGDLIHKGPYSADVVEYLRTLPNKVILIHGNHEEKQFRYERHEERIAITGGANPMKHIEEFPEITNTMNENNWEFLADAYYWYTLPGNKLVVHGGIASSMKIKHPRLHINTPATGRNHSYFKLVLRTRYEDPTGRAVSLGEQTEEDTFWADTYDGRFGHVLFGHEGHDAEAPVRYNHATALDLGVAIGGRLCALILDENGTELGYHTVKAKEQYAQPWSNKDGN